MQPDVTLNHPSLDRYRSYLLLLARWQWNPRLQGKLDPSDVVQQTLVQAYGGLAEFRGATDGELKAWLRRILSRCLTDVARKFGGAKRDAAKERSLEVIAAESSVRLERWLDDEQSSPPERAQRNEQVAQLAEAIAALPEAQQEAVTLFHLHGLSVKEIGALTGRSVEAVAGLLKRGLHALRTELNSGDEL